MLKSILVLSLMLITFHEGLAAKEPSKATRLPANSLSREEGRLLNEQVVFEQESKVLRNVSAQLIRITDNFNGVVCYTTQVSTPLTCVKVK